MKTTRILLLAATLLAACNQENMLEDTGNGNTAARLVPMTFTAAGPQTRTGLADGNDVHWTDGDRIAIWDGTNKNEFTATAISGSSATFTGQVTDGSTSYTAFYPHDLVTDMTDAGFTFTLPAAQTATAGTFANGLAPSWAQTTGGGTTLDFQNLCALVKFTVGDGMAGEGTFTLVGATATEPLAGSLTYTIGTDGNDGTLTIASDGAATRITLSGNFEAGQAYYFVVAPGTLTDGFSLWYENGEKKQYRRATSTPVTLTAGNILNLGEQTLGSFQPAITNTPFIEASDYYVEWKKETDGTVLLTQNMEKIKAVTSLSVSAKGLTDLTGIEYFTELTYLSCGFNALTSLDVSGLTNLTTLHCYNNQLTSLDVSKLTNLEILLCSENQLTKLDVSGLTNLKDLDCSNNRLTTLNVAGLSQLPSLNCSNNQLTELDLTELTGLEAMNCSQNKLTELDITPLTMLEHLHSGLQNITGNMTLYLTSEQLTTWNNTWSVVEDGYFWPYTNQNVTPVVKETGE